MLEIDNAPVVLFCIVVFVWVVPAIYGMFVDKYDKKNPQIRG